MSSGATDSSQRESLLQALHQPARPEDREAIERLYRVARVLSHDADGDRVSIEAEVPRRLMQRLQEGLSL